MEGMWCPQCGGAMKKRRGGRGEFWGCHRYPKCKGTREVPSSKEETAAPINEEMPIAEVLKLALGELRARRSVLDDFRRLKIEDLPSSVDYVGRQLERIGDALEELLVVVNAATVNLPVRET